MVNFNQLQEHIQKMRNELNDISQMANQIYQLEQNNVAQLSRLQQNESSVTQQLQRIQQICSQASQDLSQINTLSQQSAFGAGFYGTTQQQFPGQQYTYAGYTPVQQSTGFAGAGQFGAKQQHLNPVGYSPFNTGQQAMGYSGYGQQGISPQGASAYFPVTQTGTAGMSGQMTASTQGINPSLYPQNLQAQQQNQMFQGQALGK